MRVNERDGVIYKEPKTLGDRRDVARDCIDQLGLKLPAVLDGMDNAMARAYNAWPNRVYIIGGDGVVYYKGPWGPRGVSGAEFEEPLDRLLALPGGGRFTDVAPTVGLIAATPVDLEMIAIPPGFETGSVWHEKGWFSARLSREPGGTFEIDREEAIAASLDLLKSTGILASLSPGEEARVVEVVGVDRSGKEVGSRSSRLHVVRFDHYFENVPISGDRFTAVFDKKGVREFRFWWRRVEKLAAPAEAGRRSSLDAARRAKMMKAVASLSYVPRKGEDGTARFHAIWRLTQGGKVADVEVFE